MALTNQAVKTAVECSVVWWSQLRALARRGLRGGFRLSNNATSWL